MLFKGRKQFNLFKRKQKGVTIIELLLVMSVAIPLILGWLTLQREASENARIKRMGEQYAEILEAASIRTNHDSYDFSLWQTNGGRAADGNAFLLWNDTDEVVDDFFRKFLVAHRNPSCGEADGWNPADDIQSDGSTLENESMETSALLSCRFYNPMNPYNLDMRAVLTKTAGTADQVSKIAVYVDLSNSKLFDLEGNDGILSIKKLVNAADKAASASNVQGVVNVYLGEVGVLEDINDDIAVGAAAGNNGNDSTQCLRNLVGGDECTLILELNFEGSTNHQYLETNGSNSMFASIDFASGEAAGSQRCVWWKNPNYTSAQYQSTEYGSDVAAWEASMIDCGIRGGNDSEVFVDFVASNNYSENFYVARRTDPLDASAGSTPLDHMCRVYEADGDGSFVDLADTASNHKIPCGIMSNGDIVQLAVENAFVGQAFIKDLVVQEIFSNAIEIKQSTQDKNEIKADGSFDTGGITEHEIEEADILLRVADEANVDLFSIDSAGFTHIHGQLLVESQATFNDSVIIERNMQVGETVNFEMENGADVVYGTNNLVFNNAADFDIYTSSGLNLNIMATQGILNLTGENGVEIEAANGDITVENADPNSDINLNAAGDVVFDGQGGVYSTRNMVNQEIMNRNTFEALADGSDIKKDYQLLNYGFGKYLEDKTGNINIRSTVAISSGNSNIVNKPDCLDFVSSNPDRYANTEALTLANSNGGYNLARLFILPLYFKTYAAALGNNQIFSQHAIHASSTEWEVYMYLSGEGIQGTGAREDAAGSGIGMIICDFNGVSFEN